MPKKLFIGECYTCFRETCPEPNSQECKAAAYERLHEQEQIVIKYLLEITNNQIGVGTRPISFLVASHEELRRQRAQARTSLEERNAKVTSVIQQQKYAIGQLRHLYSLLTQGYIKNDAEAARGLLGPAIEEFEKSLQALEQ